MAGTWDYTPYKIFSVENNASGVTSRYWDIILGLVQSNLPYFISLIISLLHSTGYPKIIIHPWF